MLRRVIWQAVAVLMAGGSAIAAQADCAPFYESFESLASIEANGGTVTGTLTFAPGGNGNAARCEPASHVTYSDRNFRTAAGAVALWYRKSTGAASGGLWQIGTLGQASSIGLFYANTTDVWFEMRSSSGQYAQVYVPGVFSETDWSHVVAVWRELGGTSDLWLFVNGYYCGYAMLPGTLSHEAANLQVGTTGYHGHGEGWYDELRWFDWNLLDSEVWGEYVYSSNRHHRQPTGKPVSTGPVQLDGYCLTVAGQPFVVKGVDYAPTPIGSGPEYPLYADPAVIARDIPLLQVLHVNTVRTWRPPPDTQLLDALYNNGAAPIYAIIGFWIPPTGVDYGDPNTIAYYENSFGDVVNQFKDHPGVLGWGIGNEINVEASAENLVNWYRLANRLAQVAYAAEGAAYHPTIVVNGGLRGLGNVDCASDDASLSCVDLWGQNTYVGWNAHCLFDYYRCISAKPLVFTEYGIDAWNNAGGSEYPATQALWDVRQWRQIRAACLGACVMAYTDEWWKAGNPFNHDYGGYATPAHPDGFANEEWWGLCAIAPSGSGPDLLYPRQAYDSLGQEFLCAPADHEPDGDVDLLDFAALQICCGAVAVGECGAAFDLVVDDVIDALDFRAALSRMNGPDQPPGCPG